MTQEQIRNSALISCKTSSWGFLYETIVTKDGEVYRISPYTDLYDSYLSMISYPNIKLIGRLSKEALLNVEKYIAEEIIDNKNMKYKMMFDLTKRLELNLDGKNFALNNIEIDGESIIYLVERKIEDELLRLNSNNNAEKHIL